MERKGIGLGLDWTGRDKDKVWQFEERRGRERSGLEWKGQGKERGVIKFEIET